MRRKSICLSAILAIGLLVPGISRAAAPFSGMTLHVQFWGSDEGRAIQKHVVDPFTQATGANVVVEYGNTSASIAKVLAQKNDPQLDVVMFDDIGAVTLERSGALDRLDLNKLPHAREIYPAYVIANGYGIGFATYINTILYNTKMAQAPKSWRDLWDPRYKGKVILPVVTNTAGLQVAIMAAKLNGGSLSNMDPAWPMLGRLKPNVYAMQGNHALTGELLKSGDVWYAVDLTFYYKPFIQQGYPIAMTVDLQEGYFSATETVSLVKGGKGNRDLAYAFIDQTLKPESQAALAADLWYGPTNPNAKLTALERKWMLYTPQQYAKAIPVDLLELQKLRPAIIDKWNNVLQ
jgi:putative spermidine/putrescine transport system substrate-binding protein